jgi:hypothetical protein
MKYTQEQIHATIQEWQESGLSKKAFCRDRKITYQTFHYWFKKLSPKPPSGFAEVKLEPPARFELTFPSGTRMTFQGEPSVSWLRELLK